jgi:hypothetical protein
MPMTERARRGEGMRGFEAGGPTIRADDAELVTGQRETHQDLIA